MVSQMQAEMLDALEFCSAWIEPDGSFHGVVEAGHYSWAIPRGGYESLIAAGWLHLSYGNIYSKRKSTQPQIDTLFDFLDLARSKRMKNSTISHFQRQLEILMSGD